MTNPGDLLSVDEVAEIARVSPATVRFWIKRRRLTSIRPGRHRMVRRTDLEAMLARNERRACVPAVAAGRGSTKRESPEAGTSRLSEAVHPKSGAEDHEESRSPDHPEPAAIRR